jgi:transposase
MCVQSGPRRDGSRLASDTVGGFDWDAGCGDDRQNTSAYFLQGKAIKEICRELRISRKVVRKVIRTGATEFRYERSRQPMPRLGVWRERLEASLEANAQKPPRDRLTLVRIFEDMQGLGFDGSYAALRRYAVSWREQHSSATSTAYIPLTFAPGEAYQFDWSHEIVVIGGVTTTVKVAHVRLCHSRMMFVRAYPRATQEMVFDAHERAFAFFKGACQRGIYDTSPSIRASSGAARRLTTPGVTSRSSRASLGRFATALRSPSPAGSFSSTSSAFSTSAPRSFSPRISPSANGRACSASRR